MAALSTEYPTILDHAKRMEPDGSIAKYAELLAQNNEILTDMVWKEGNLATGHQFTAQAGLPDVYWRKLNVGTPNSKGRTVQATVTCGMLEARGAVDEKLANLNGNSAAFRLSEDRMKIESMSQEMASTVFFGNDGSEPEAFTGLAPAYNSTTAANGENIILGGSAVGQTDNTSIWFLGWSPETIFGTFPKGSMAGLKNQDLGLDDELDASGNPFRAYKSLYQWDAGLCIKDWRFGVRIPNIDKSLLSTTWTAGAFSTGADLSDLMAQAIDRFPSTGMVRAAFYMSRNTKSFLRRQVSAKTQGSTLTSENVGGVVIDRFQGFPIRLCDALAADEARVA